MEPYKRNTRVLYVDDEQALLTVFGLLLRKEGVEIHTLQDPTQIGSMLDEHGPFAIVLSDQRMPGMDGVKVLEAVAHRHPSTVRVMVTGFVDHADTTRAINVAGIASYIAKPWNDALLRILIQESVDRYNLTEEKAHVAHQLASSQESLAALLAQATNGDIHERRDAVELVASLVREKELMLKEIHHRVKNNLQIISSVLNMQAMNITSIAVRAPFVRATGRIRSMAMVHEALYRSDDLGSIDFTRYLENLASEISSIFNMESVSWSVTGERLALGIDLAVPLGMIAHELITNAFMHAFKGSAKGTVTVTLLRGDAGGLTLCIHDDGCGRSSVKPAASGIGLTLVTALVEDVGATLSCIEDAGTHYRLDLPTAMTN
ncbi:MAG: response regulator [Ignavibacteriae bacterium]|nr:response regulator [Ignavibacteriota bacterium]